MIIIQIASPHLSSSLKNPTAGFLHALLHLPYRPRMQLEHMKNSPDNTYLTAIFHSPSFIHFCILRKLGEIIARAQQSCDIRAKGSWREFTRSIMRTHAQLSPTIYQPSITNRFLWISSKRKRIILHLRMLGRGCFLWQLTLKDISSLDVPMLKVLWNKLRVKTPK